VVQHRRLGGYLRLVALLRQPQAVGCLRLRGGCQVSAATIEKQQTVYLDGRIYVMRGNNITEVKR
jgi:hypothetical protein